MKKLAIFVEGHTEQEFVEKLLREVIGALHLRIESYDAIGGRKPGSRKFQLVHVSDPTSDARYLAMVVDCGADSRVRSDIQERYAGLIAAGFSQIIGVRDVFPDVAFGQIAMLRKGLQVGLPNTPIQVLFVLGVMEIETWFLSEFTHFEKIDAKLTPRVIQKALGFDPVSDDLQLRLNPAADLHAAYQLVGLGYRKSKTEIQRTVNVLDYSRLYLGMTGRLSDLDALNAALDQFLS